MRKSCAKTGRANTMDSVVGKGGKGMFWHHEQMSPDRPCRPSWKRTVCNKCHICHTKVTSMSSSATPATQNTVPATKPATRASPVPTPATQKHLPSQKVPCLVIKCCHAKVTCRKCHACHTKALSMSESATPATQK